MNFDKIGIVHTGMLGDAILGGRYLSNSLNHEVNLFAKATSIKFKDKIKSAKLKYYDENQELLNLYSRGFSGMNLVTP